LRRRLRVLGTSIFCCSWRANARAPGFLQCGWCPRRARNALRDQGMALGTIIFGCRRRSTTIFARRRLRHTMHWVERRPFVQPGPCAIQLIARVTEPILTATPALATRPDSEFDSVAGGRQFVLSLIRGDGSGALLRAPSKRLRAILLSQLRPTTPLAPRLNYWLQKLYELSFETATSGIRRFFCCAAGCIPKHCSKQAHVLSEERGTGEMQRRLSQNGLWIA
jgi:hypothetical protein